MQDHIVLIGQLHSTRYVNVGPKRDGHVTFINYGITVFILERQDLQWNIVAKQ